MLNFLDFIDTDSKEKKIDEASVEYSFDDIVSSLEWVKKSSEDFTKWIGTRIMHTKRNGEKVNPLIFKNLSSAVDSNLQELLDTVKGLHNIIDGYYKQHKN